MKARILAALVMATSCMVSGQAFADEALAKSKNCMSCHAIDKKKDGPPYKEIAGKYKGKADNLIRKEVVIQLDLKAKKI